MTPYQITEYPIENMVKSFALFLADQLLTHSCAINEGLRIVNATYPKHTKGHFIEVQYYLADNLHWVGMRQFLHGNSGSCRDIGNIVYMVSSIWTGKF